MDVHSCLRTQLHQDVTGMHAGKSKACMWPRQASTSDTQKLDANGFAAVRILYDQQDKVVEIPAHRDVDGPAKGSGPEELCT